jgi:aryl-alcohol dehydrogenase-like predicted oxidoreductase
VSSYSFLNPQTRILILSRAGRIRHVGLSEISASTLRRARAVHPIVTIGVGHLLVVLNSEGKIIGLLGTARDVGVEIVTYGSAVQPDKRTQ